MSTTPSVSDTWEQGNPYERYIGRWSRQVAPRFLDWLGAAPGQRWLDVGCGTGALSAAILDRCAPASVVGVEPSEGFRASASRRLGERARVLAGDGAHLPLDDGACDVVVSGLVLNFVPDVHAALREMARVGTPGATVAAYVWDYADRMEVIARFWDTAVSLDPAAAALHEATRFPLCTPAALAAAFEGAGLRDVQTGSVEVTAAFADFDDYWQPFLGGQGPAPAYVAQLSDAGRAALRSRLQRSLPAGPDGRLSLAARAWAVRGATHDAARGG
jgi:SAM-dependent methyltransferase